MDNIKINTNITLPMPVTVVGSMQDDKPNFMAVGWVSRANAVPPMVTISVGKSHVTNNLIKTTGEFSLNVVSKEQVEKADFVGIYSADKQDKSRVFEVFYGELKNAPMIKGAIVSAECKVVSHIDLETNTLFIAEIKEAWSQDKFISNKHIDYKNTGALILTMPDNHYSLIGDSVAKAWKVGLIK